MLEFNIVSRPGLRAEMGTEDYECERGSAFSRLHGGHAATRPLALSLQSLQLAWTPTPPWGSGSL